MNLAELSIRNSTTFIVLSIVFFFGGLVAFMDLSWLEDPEFTIKEALVVTHYPGASAVEVEQEVSDELERAVQQLGQLKEVESKSEQGISTLTIRIKDAYKSDQLPQVWDELRRKIRDASGNLPPGATQPVVIDDYADVYGVYLALNGDEYSYAELKQVATFLRKELLMVEDVAKIDFWGEQTEAIYIEPDRDRISQLGISTQAIAQAIQNKNVVSDAGSVDVGGERIKIMPTGTFQSVSDFGELLITGQQKGNQIYLRDIASIRKGYVEPTNRILTYDGRSAIGIGISTVKGGNVVVMGDGITQRLSQLEDKIPLGVNIDVISFQSEAVTQAIEAFVVNLIEAVVIVVAVLLLFMGLRSGLIIGFVLSLTIAATFILMQSWNVALERISLGALIIALGMLVDNAIVVVDGVLVRLKQGMKADKAAIDVVKQTSLPLAGATAVAVMAFGAIGLSDDSTGEFCRSLFQVVFLSLSLSWVTAVTITPILCVLFLKAPNHAERTESESHDSALYRHYKQALMLCLQHRGKFVVVIVGVFVLSLVGFGSVKQSFFPDSTRPQFAVDMWLPQGTDIMETKFQAAKVERFLMAQQETTHVTSFIGEGGMRFMLTYSPETPNTAYAQFLVDVADHKEIAGLTERIDDQLKNLVPDALIYSKAFKFGPGGSKFNIRVSGPDTDKLRAYAEQIKTIMHEDGGLKAIRTDWRNKVKNTVPVLSIDEANRAGIDKQAVANAIKATYEGQSIGIYRQNDELLPIVVRAPQSEREDVANMQNIQVFSPSANSSVSLRQVVAEFNTEYQDGIIQRLNRKRTISVLAEPIHEEASTVLQRIKPIVDAMKLEPGYELLWWGEYKDSKEAETGIGASIPFFFLVMVLIVVALFNAMKQPLVIWLTVPLSIIGVCAGLLITNQPFGFMALLGCLSLSGMLIKNAVVLIDEIEVQKQSGASLLPAIIDSSVSRLRPVAMAALTTALGMIPLIFDAFFVSMAVSIVFGLMVATILTMFVVPVLYALFFQAPKSLNR